MGLLHLIWVLLGIGLCSELPAQEIEEKARELAQVQARIEAVRATIEAIKEQKGGFVSELGELEKRYGAIADSIRIVERRMHEHEQQRQALAKQRDDERAQIDAQREGLVGQVRAAYANGRQERLKLILNQNDPVKASRIMVYYEYFNRARLSRIRSIEEGLRSLQRLESELLAETERLTELRNQALAERDALEQARAERRRLLSQLERELEQRGDELAQLRQDESRLVQLIDSIRKALESFPVDEDEARPFHQRRGTLLWPVKGALLQRFGSRRVVGRWEGVLLGAPEGATVRAVAPGRVVYADWLRGYGLLLIIDHGGGYMTLYAFNQSLFKRAGQRVSAGEAIASVGNSGGRTRTGLYFEIRDKGRPVNPERWCRTQSAAKRRRG